MRDWEVMLSERVRENEGRKDLHSVVTFHLVSVLCVVREGMAQGVSKIRQV